MESSISSINSRTSIFACKCSKAMKNTTRVAKTGCGDDSNAIAMLPDDWVPRRSGPILANYLKQRKQDHQNINEDIIKSAAKANADTDDKIRNTAEILLADINHNQLQIDCVVQKGNNMKILNTKGIYDEALKSIDDLRLRRVEDLANFVRESAVLESERTDKLKSILRDNFQRLVIVGHMTPKELLHDFDTRIYEINQQLMSNSRAYKELEAKLLLQLDKSVAHARSNLNQLSLGIGVVYRQYESLSALRHPMQESLSKRPPSAVRLCEPLLTGTLSDHVEELDACVARLVEAYRVAVLNVYTGYYSKLDNLQNNLYTHEAIVDRVHIPRTDLADLQKVIESLLRRLSSLAETEPVLANTNIIDITGSDMILMQKSLSSLGGHLQETYSLLHNAGHLWDNHLLRSALAQKLTIEAVEDLLTSNDSIELANEIALNIALEQLRCFSDAEKINQQFDAIMSMLGHTAQMYLQHSESELGRLEAFMNLSTSMTNILVSELDLFLAKYPRSAQAVELKTTPGLPCLPLSRALLQTQLQEKSLQNWRNGFLESFKGNMSLVPEELRQLAQLWIEEQSTSLHMRYSLKVISHSIRAERIKALRNARVAELHYHESRLQSHLNAVYDLVDSLPIQATEFGAVDAPFLYPLAKWLDRIQTTINCVLAQDPPNLEVKKCTMSSLAIRLPMHRRKFEQSLDKAIADFKLYIEHRVQEARISNVRFLSQIKLFSEGGRYSAQEAIKTCTALSKASDVLETCSSKANDALHLRRIQLLAYADNQVLPLMRMLEGPGKSAAKSSIKPARQDKKIITSMKK